MKIKTTQDVSNVKTWEELKKFSSNVFGALLAEINGRLSLTENLLAQRLEYRFTAGGVEVGVAHGLGFIPNGYIQIKADGGVIVYDGATANTRDTLYLKATGAGIVSVLVF